MTGAQRVVVVTGGGGGIGAAVAEALGRDGAFVVTVDPLVTVDGAEQLASQEATTADRIVAAGGSARASSASVTDGDAIRALFGELVEEHGRLDAVVNVAGISRPTSFASGSESDWLDVLAVHLHGYLNVLGAAMPIMAAAGRGHILGVTSGSGWRPSDTGAYGCAKRAVASLTWQLGREAPAGIVVNAMSPIAMTRMVTSALERARGARGSGSSASGGLSLASMPAPDQLGPFGAHLVDDDFDWCRGRVFFAGGSEVAVVEEPRLLEVVRTDDTSRLAHVLEAFTTGALAPAEANQGSGGGTNPRFGSIYEPSTDGEALPASAVRTCAVVADRVDVAKAVAAALDARGVRIVHVDDRTPGFDGASAALTAATESAGPLDAVVVALSGRAPATGAASAWERVLAEHTGIIEQIHADAGWARAVADLAVAADHPVRLVTLTDAATAGGRSRAQAAAQHARAAHQATGDRVSAFAVSVEMPGERGSASVGEVAAHLVCRADAPALSGAELVVGDGWFGLRSHPRPTGSITFGGPAVPTWLDDVLRTIVAVR